VQVVILAALSQRVKAMGFYDIKVEGFHPYLHSYHVAYSNLQVYMFTNEHPTRRIDTRVSIPGQGRALVYDAFHDQVTELQSTQDQGRIAFQLRLSPYSEQVIVLGPGVDRLPIEQIIQAQVYGFNTDLVIPGPWKISIATSEQYPNFQEFGQKNSLGDMSVPGTLPAFSGTFRYETQFDWAQPVTSMLLDMGEVFEIGEVWLNGKRLGLRICPPYQFEVGNALKQGKNALVVEVTNTLVKAQPDFFSRYVQQEPSGLIGPVRLLY
jgi:hypothetical protein